MADFDKIENLEQLQGWLKTQDPRMSRAIAARVSLRSLPAAMAIVDQNFESLNPPDLILACFRATLITGVASTCPTPVMTKVNAAADSAALSAVFADAATGKKGQHADVFAWRLWPSTKNITPLLEFWEGFSARPDPDATWAFWRKWYQGMLDGTPMDWDLQLRVALIDDAVWEEGAGAVAEAIRAIQLKRQTSVAPGLVRDSENLAFHIEAETALPRDILEYAHKRIEGALENALQSAGPNGLRDDSYESITLRRALDENPESASLLATGFYDACLSFQSTIGEQYPEDIALINLRNALWGVVEEINEVHPDARRRCARLADATNSAIGLVHHIRKSNGQEADVDSIRGAGSLIGAARVARIINKITKQDAAKLGIDEETAKSVFRVENGKANLSPPAENSVWRRMKGEHLANGEWVGVAHAYQIPTIEPLSEHDQLKVQRAIELAPEPAKSSEKAKDWAGYIAANALGVDIGHGTKADRSHDQEIERVRIRDLFGLMVKYSFLRKSEFYDKRNGRPVPIYEVGDSIEDAFKCGESP